MRHDTNMEMLLLPSSNGMIKIYIYGFKTSKSYGKVFVEYNGITVEDKGSRKEKLIIKALTKLHQALVNEKDS